MARSPVHLRAPGIQAMEKGQPWKIPGNRFLRQPASKTLQLVPIQTIIQSAETPDVAPLSPISLVGTTFRAGVPQESTKDAKPGCQHASVQGLTSAQQSLSSLIIPEVAKPSSGGCFDTENWVFKIVWNHVHHMDIDQLMSAYFLREDRGKYGEHHTSTRGVPDFDRSEEDTRRTGKGSDNHRHQEQGRRVRHRYLQGGSDECISTFILDMAQDELPKIKEIIRQMHSQNKTAEKAGACAEERQGAKSYSSTGTARKLGKDDQLTAVLMSQYVAFIIISRLQETIADCRAENEALRSQFDCLTAPEERVEQRPKTDAMDNYRRPCVEATNWRDQCERLEADKRSLQDEVGALRQQLRDIKICHETSPLPISPLLPVPSATASETKRPLACTEDSSWVPLPTQTRSAAGSFKRQRTGLVPPRTTIMHINGQHRLPPSPTPSQDDAPFSFSCLC